MEHNPLVENADHQHVGLKSSGQSIKEETLESRRSKEDLIVAKDIQRVADLFDGKKQYRTPLYQRRYVWQETNWKALWEDIKKIQRQLEIGEEEREHFTGTIVTQSDENESALDKYEIIDGQQRLVTFQVIFCIIRDIAASPEYVDSPEYADSGLGSKIKGIIELPEYDIKREKSRLARISEQINNNVEDGFSPYSLVLKGRDNDTFESLVKNEKRDPSNIITNAYVYFNNEIRAYLKKEGLSKLQNLMDALAYNFHVVQVKIEPNDDPQQIFGSINGTGRILDEFDLLRNDLFLRVKDGNKKDALYKKYWSNFDEENFWEKPGRVDNFLRDFLKAKLGPTDFSGKRLFHDVYKGQYHAKLESVEKEFEELAKYAEIYKKLEERSTDLGCRMQFYDDLKIASLRPFILFLKNELDKSDKDLEQICDILESYIMRRMVNSGYGTNDEDKGAYEKIDKFFSRLIAGEEFSMGNFVQFLRSGKSDDLSFWPTNTQILGGRRRHQRSGVTAGGLQRTADEMHFGKHSSQSAAVSLLCYIFYRIERHTNIEASLSFEDFSNVPTRLTVLPDEGRDWRSIGNLTFRVENGMDEEDVNYYPFYMIKDILLEPANANIKLNRDICKSESWDVEQIRERTQKLGSYFCEIWPDGNSFSRSISTRAPQYVPDHNKFNTKKLYEGVVKNWGSDYSFSYIESSELSWLRYDIEAGADSLDPSIFSRKLHPGLKVKFNIKMIQKDKHLRFQADNVTLFTTGELYQGEVKWVEPDERFGFLISDAYPDDIYVNRTQFCSENADSLKKGQILEFNIAETVEGKYPAAINVRAVKP